MRKFYILLIALFVGFAVPAQTLLIDPNTTGGFESAADFTGNGWTVANTTNANKWFLGTVPGAAGFTSRAAYVSNDAAGTTWTYTTGSISVSHFYRDVTIPAGETNVSLSFNWQALGESGSYDVLMVSVAPTSYVPAGSTTSLSTGGLAAPAVSFVQLWNNNSYQTANVKIPSSLLNNCSSAATIRLIFTWKNDGSGGANPPAAIDNISLTSQTGTIPSTGGTYTINNTQATGGTNFANFTDAINALNGSGSCFTGPVTFNVSAGQTFAENVPGIMVSGSVSNPIAFQKSGAGANPVISATGTTGSTDFGFCISGGDYITINGIDIAIASGSAVEYGYLIRNAHSTDGANYNTIKNSKITLNRANTSSWGIYQSISSTQGGTAPTAASGANSYNKYYNITIENAYSGIRLLGNASFPDVGCEIGVEAGGTTTIGSSAANDIGNGSSAVQGIYLSAQSTFKVFNCIIRNLTHTSTSTTNAGVYVDNGTTGTYGVGEIYNCHIYNISRITSTSGSGNIYGIRTDVQATAGNEVKVYNNFIYGLSFSNPTTATANISIRGLGGNISGTGFTSFYHNSVNIVHSTASHGSAALYTTGGTLNITNNILVNTSVAQSGTSKHYAIYRSGGTLSSNNNDLYVTNTNGFTGYFTADRATLADWQTASSADGSSININPPFTSATDLHIPIGTTTDLESRGASVGIAFDIDGETRPGPTNTNGGGTAPDIGADEFDGTPTVPACSAPADQATGLTFGTATTTSQPGSFTAAVNAPSGYLVVRSVGALNTNPVDGTAYGAGIALGNGFVISSSSSTSFTASGLTSNTQYTYTIFAYNAANCSGGPIYNTTSPLSGTATTCTAVPAGIALTNITTTSFDLTWNTSAGGGAGTVSYTVDIATDGAFASPITGSPFTVADNTPTVTLNVTGLTAATTYYYRLRSTNGSCTSANSTAASVSTLCNAANLPLAEGFNGVTIPNCWSRQFVSGTKAFSFGDATTAGGTSPNPAPYEGSGRVLFPSYSNSGNQTRLVSPLINSTGTSSIDVNFQWYHSATGGAGSYLTEGVQIQYSLDGTTWVNAGSLIRRYDAATGWAAKSVTLPAAAGNQASLYVGFLFTSNAGYDSYLDAVSIESTPTTPCVAPVDQATSLTFGTQGITSQAGSFTAAASTPTGYLVVRSVGALNTNPIDGTVYATGASLGNGTVVQSGSALTFTASGLTGNTDYTFTVLGYNNTSCLGGPAYNTVSPLTGNAVTCPATPSSVTVTNKTSTGFILTWNSSKGGEAVMPMDYTIEVSTENTFTTGMIAGSPFTFTDSTTVQNTMRFEITGLTLLTQYYYRIKGSGCNTAYSSTSSTTTLGTPPANDDATGAINLTVGGGCTGNPYTNLNATQGVTEPFATCKGAGGFSTVWFSFVAPASGSVKISNDYSGGTMGTDSKMSLFSTTNVADYTTFTQLACDDDNGITVSQRSILYAAGLTPGTTYYIQVDGYASGTTTGTFCITVDELVSSMLSPTGACSSTESLSSINTGYNGSLSLVDANGRLVAIVKDNAGSGGTYDGSVTVNASGTVRQSNGIYYLDRNYRINNSAATNVDVQFFFLDTELAALNTANGATLGTIGVTRQTGTTCRSSFVAANGSSSFLPQTANGANGGVSWIKVNTPGFSNFYIQAAGGAILPANILTFSGVRAGNVNKLKWVVAQETDVRAYEVERSEDGRTWSKAGDVASLGNSSTQRTYSFTDNNISGLKQLYRLRQLDRNGSAKLSNTIMINGVKATVLTLNGLFPNPAVSKVNVLLDAPAKDYVTIHVMDGLGRVVRTQKVEVEAGSNTVEINVNNLAAGTYMLKLNSANNSQSSFGKFIKE